MLIGVKCKYLDFDYGKCHCRARRNWYSILMPDCVYKESRCNTCQYQPTLTGKKSKPCK